MAKFDLRERYEYPPHTSSSTSTPSAYSSTTSYTFHTSPTYSSAHRTSYTPRWLQSTPSYAQSTPSVYSYTDADGRSDDVVSQELSDADHEEYLDSLPPPPGSSREAVLEWKKRVGPEVSERFVKPGLGYYVDPLSLRVFRGVHAGKSCVSHYDYKPGEKHMIPEMYRKPCDRAIPKYSDAIEHIKDRLYGQTSEVSDKVFDINSSFTSNRTFENMYKHFSQCVSSKTYNKIKYTHLSILQVSLEYWMYYLEQSAVQRWVEKNNSFHENAAVIRATPDLYSQHLAEMFHVHLLMDQCTHLRQHVAKIAVSLSEIPLVEERATEHESLEELNKLLDGMTSVHNALHSMDRFFPSRDLDWYDPIEHVVGRGTVEKASPVLKLHQFSAGVYYTLPVRQIVESTLYEFCLLDKSQQAAVKPYVPTLNLMTRNKSINLYSKQCKNRKLFPAMFADQVTADDPKTYMAGLRKKYPHIISIPVDEVASLSRECVLELRFDELFKMTRDQLEHLYPLHIFNW